MAEPVSSSALTETQPAQQRPDVGHEPSPGLRATTCPGGGTTHRQRIARACLVTDVTDQQREQIAISVLAELDAAGLVILPAVANHRMRHEACKGAPGVNAGTFAAMWDRVVAHARAVSLENGHGR